MYYLEIQGLFKTSSQIQRLFSPYEPWISIPPNQNQLLFRLSLESQHISVLEKLKIGLENSLNFDLIKLYKPWISCHINTLLCELSD